MLTRAALVAAAAGLGLLAAGCGSVVETGPTATPGQGFEDIVRIAPATTSVPTTDATTGDTAPGAATTVAVAPDDELFAIGTCLTWGQGESTSGFEAVRCDQEHLVEVAGSGDLSARFGPDAPFPDEQELQTAVAEVCDPIVTSYLGRAVNDGEDPGVIPPTEAGWAAGERVVHCTVGLARQDGERPPYTGHLADRRVT